MTEVFNNDTGPAPPYKRNKKKKKNSRFMRNAKGFAKQGIFGRGSHIDDDQYNYFINILDSMKNGFEEPDDKVTMANNVFEQTKGQEIFLASNQIVCKALETLCPFVDAEMLETYFNTFADSFRPICSDRFASHVLQKLIEVAFLRTVCKDSIETKDGGKEEAAEDDAPAAKKAKMSKDMLNEETYNLETEFTEEHKTNCGNFVLRIGKFMLNNLEDFVWDSCASHIMRTSILCLSGIHVAKVAFAKGGAEIAKNKKIYTVPDEWHEVAKEFAQRLEMWPQFTDLPYQEHSSALLAVLCVSLRVMDKSFLKHFGKKILMEALLKVEEEEGAGDDDKPKKIEISDEEEDNENGQVEKVPNQKEALKPKLPKVFEYQSAVILLETLLTVAGPKLLTQLYAMLFTSRMAMLAKEPLTNFAVQKLLQNIKEKEDFENIFQELQDEVEELLKIGHTGVITSLTAACHRLQCKQAQMLQSLQAALHVLNDKEKLKSFFACLLKLKPFDVLEKEKSAAPSATTFVHLHGSVIIQDILKFNKPIFMVNCILETSADQLVAIFSTPNGSHICEAFLQSKFIGEKSREKLLRHLEGFYVDLAITKFGSRVLESCFNAAAQEQQKSKIVKELADKINMLKGSPFGKIICSKLRVDMYRLSAAQWKASFLNQKESKAQELFKDIIN